MPICLYFKCPWKCRGLKAYSSADESMMPGGTFKWGGWGRTLEGELEPQPLLLSLCLPVACGEELDFICVPLAQRPQSQPTTVETSEPLSQNIPCLFLTYFSRTFCHSNTKLAQSGVISLMPDGSCRMNAYFYKGGIFFFFWNVPSILVPNKI